MTAQQEHAKVFRASLIAEEIVDGVRFRLYSNRIFHVTVPRYHKVKRAVIDAGYAFLDKNGGGKFYNIYEFRSFSDVDPEIRDWAADTSGNHYTHADAIVIGNLAHKIMSDFYLHFHKPIKPTRIFYSIEKAAEWTLSLMSENAP